MAGHMSPSIGFIADQTVLYGSPDGESINDLHRIPLKIERTDAIPKVRAIARAKAHRDMKRNLKETRIAIKYLRRYQAQKVVLDAIEKNSAKYGDRVRRGTGLSIKAIQNKITEENTSAMVKYESDNITKFSKMTALKTAVSRGLWEKLYIARFKAKAFLFYNKQEKRSLRLAGVNSHIDNHKKKLRGHLFHNFNINAINCGKIKIADDYKGIFPDPADVMYVNSYINNKNKNNNANNNADLDNDKDNENVNTLENENTKRNENTVEQTNRNENTVEQTNRNENTVEQTNRNENKNDYSDTIIRRHQVNPNRNAENNNTRENTNTKTNNGYNSNKPVNNVFNNFAQDNINKQQQKKKPVKPLHQGRDIELLNMLNDHNNQKNNNGPSDEVVKRNFVPNNQQQTKKPVKPLHQKREMELFAMLNDYNSQKSNNGPSNQDSKGNGMTR